MQRYRFCSFKIDLLLGYTKAVTLRIHKGLRELGLNTDSTNEFSEFTDNINRQAARYNWLKFAAFIAEEQGV